MRLSKNSQVNSELNLEMRALFIFKWPYLSTCLNFSVFPTAFLFIMSIPSRLIAACNLYHYGLWHHFQFHVTFIKLNYRTYFFFPTSCFLGYSSTGLHSERSLKIGFYPSCAKLHLQRWCKITLTITVGVCSNSTNHKIPLLFNVQKTFSSTLYTSFF